MSGIKTRKQNSSPLAADRALNPVHSYALAKAKGVHFGRKPGAIIKTKEDKEKEYAKVLRELQHGTSIARTAKLCDVSESTVKRLKKEFGI